VAHTVVATPNYCGCTGDNADSGIYSEGVVSLVCDKITRSRIICVTEYSGEGDRSFRLNVTDYSGLT
jgi:hypothetical protein